MSVPAMLYVANTMQSMAGALLAHMICTISGFNLYLVVKCKPLGTSLEQLLVKKKRNRLEENLYPDFESKNMVSIELKETI